MYKEIERNYVAVEVVANQVLHMAKAPKVGSSRQVKPSESSTMVVASAGVDVLVGAPLPKKNLMSLYELDVLDCRFRRR